MSKETSSDLSCLHAVVHGWVQGVFFRAFVRGRACGLGLAGWVRNLPEGTVEVYAEGPRASLERLLEHLGVGPRGARVERVETEWGQARGELSRFKIRHY